MPRTGRPSRPLRAPPNRLRAVRIAKGMTQEELGRRARIDGKTIQKLETGATVFKVPQLEACAAAMGVSPCELLNSVDPLANAHQRAIVSIFRRLPPAECDRVVRMAAALLPTGTEREAG